MKPLRILACLSLALPLSLMSCKPTEFEAGDVESVILEFYAWYIISVKHEQYDQYQPAFMPDEQGMTRLDVSTYANNLRRFHFSEALIEQELSFYAVCSENVGHIPYETFDQEYVDLDQFEQISCEFGNRYRWFGGMEGSVERARILTTEVLTPTEAVVVLELLDTDDSTIGGRRIILTQTHANWKIHAIE
ncbi:MAG: hypothetical protein AAF587_24660 [Bacteroidota bacterium]